MFSQMCLIFDMKTGHYTPTSWLHSNCIDIIWTLYKWYIRDEVITVCHRHTLHKLYSNITGSLSLGVMARIVIVFYIFVRRLTTMHQQIGWESRSSLSDWGERMRGDGWVRGRGRKRGEWEAGDESACSRCTRCSFPLRPAAALKHQTTSRWLKKVFQWM